LHRKFHKTSFKVNIGQFKTFMTRMIEVTTHNLECHSQSIRPSASLTSNYTKFYVMVSIAFLEATGRTSHNISSQLSEGYLKILNTVLTQTATSWRG
jgi:hypothetical protein